MSKKPSDSCAGFGCYKDSRAIRGLSHIVDTILLSYKIHNPDDKERMYLVNQNIRKSFVRKKSPMIITTRETTTVRVVALPTPWVPPSVFIPT